MATALHRVHPDVKVLHNVPYEMYSFLVGDAANAHLRMSYLDGTLELVSPIKLEHERPSRRLGLIVSTIAEALELSFEGTESTTFKKAGPGRFSGAGKEPDQAFYLASVDRLPRDREVDLNAGDPPPDLWIEVDNRASSTSRMPIYAAIGVPEVWRYWAQTQKLQFLHLVGDRYEPLERSLSLPILTPELVLEALALGDGLREIESRWIPQLREWTRRILADRGQ